MKFGEAGREVKIRKSNAIRLLDGLSSVGRAAGNGLDCLILVK